ncbi:MAG: hypothetical protein EPO35_12040, partial [Acidobacteria bacterium]
MTNDPVILALVALLAPVASFLLIAAVFPLRRSGKPAAYLSIAAVGLSLVAAVRLWLVMGTAEGPVHHAWSWLPAYEKAFASVDQHADAG